MLVLLFSSLSVFLVGTPYAGVIPIEKALDPYGDAILAYEMNGNNTCISDVPALLCNDVFGLVCW